MKTLLRYPGGKSRLAKRIVGLFPDLTDYKYIEPFLGGGSVFLETLNSRPAKMYLLSDIDVHLIDFWKMVVGNPLRLAYQIRTKLQENSDRKSLFLSLKGYLTTDLLNQVMNASSFYLVNRMSFGGLGTAGSYSETAAKTRLPRLENISDLFSNLGNQIMSHTFFHKEEKQLIISAHDYEKVFKNNQQKDNFFYLDPPYKIDSKNLYGERGKNHRDFDFQKFVDAVHKIQGKFLISFNDCSFARQAFKKYNIQELSGYKYSLAKKQGNEIVITNY